MIRDCRRRVFIISISMFAAACPASCLPACLLLPLYVNAIYGSKAGECKAGECKAGECKTGVCFTLGDVAVHLVHATATPPRTAHTGAMTGARSVSYGFTVLHGNLQPPPLLHCLSTAASAHLGSRASAHVSALPLGAIVMRVPSFCA